jgi:hypothetical protein
MTMGKPRPGSRPPEVDRPLARLRTLDAEIAKHELCRPGFAAELRREASAVACGLENIRTSIVCAEINGRRQR